MSYPVSTFDGMTQVRPLSELVDARVDEEWLHEVVAWRSRSIPVADQPLALKCFARAERAFTASRLITAVAVAEETVELAELGRGGFGPYEVAVALNVTAGAATGQVQRGNALLTRFPLTLARLADGRISEYHVIRLLELARSLADEDLLARCERLIWRHADPRRLTPGQLAALARRILATVDPHAFDRTHEQERRYADVTVRHDLGSGMAWLSAYLPTLDAAMVMTMVDTAANAAKAAGDPRPLGQLRAEALRHAAEAHLTGATTATSLTADGTHSTDPTADGSTAAPAEERPRREAGRTATRRARRPVELQVAVSYETVIGASDAPGEIPGAGPVPAQAIRDLLADARVRLITYDRDTGRMLDYGRKTYRAPALLAGAVTALYQTSIGPGSTTPAANSDLDHTNPYPTGSTSYLNLDLPTLFRTVAVG